MKEETVLDIIVAPKASKSAIKIDENCIKVYLKSPPINGKANAECLKLFSKRLKIPLKNISVKMGKKSKRKRINISGISFEDTMNILKADSK